MARKRMISPEFFTSAPVNRLPIPAMITFAGLWCYFDDFGRGEDDPALIKAAVWPRRKAQTEARVAADLAAIEAVGLVCRYAAGVIHNQGLAKSLSGAVTERSRDQSVTMAIRLIHTPTWPEHQKISHPTPSKFAPCPIHEPQDHAAYLRLSGKFPETLANGSRPPP